MRAVAPRIRGCPEITVAEDQHQYMSITVAVVQYEGGDRGVMTRWRLDDADRARIAAGEDLYVGILTFGGPMHPLQISVGNPWGEEEDRE